LERLLNVSRPSLTLVTLGVRDHARARSFYVTLGFDLLEGSNDSVSFLDVGGTLLALFGRSDLAADAQVADTPTGFSGIALARNVENEAAVDRVLQEAVAAGATLTKPGQKTFWGGYAGYFADPDGHLWEVAYNPYWTMDAEGCVRLAPAGDTAR
jgi:catechol 2,3-dioxygenase-like lactoylglutathione lyase family enzyme